MADLILVKVAPLTHAVIEVMIPAGSTVTDALNAAAKAGARIEGYTDLHKNGKIAGPYDLVNNLDIIVLVPAIKGGST